MASSDGTAALVAGLAVIWTGNGPFSRASAETMTRISEPGVLAGARKVACPSCTAIGTGSPTRHNDCWCVSAPAATGGGTPHEPPHWIKPISAAAAQGNIGGEAYAIGTHSGERIGDRRTDFPTARPSLRAR